MSNSSLRGVCSLNFLISNGKDLALTRTIAPAVDAVEYQSVRYNVTTKNNRYVGAGPEIDEAWREISYDSELFILVLCWFDLRFGSGRSNDHTRRALWTWHARKLVESHPSRDGGAGLSCRNGSLPPSSLSQSPEKSDLQGILRALGRRVRPWSRSSAGSHR